LETADIELVGERAGRRPATVRDPPKSRFVRDVCPWRLGTCSAEAVDPEVADQEVFDVLS
jgi:hypothetical protein